MRMKNRMNGFYERESNSKRETVPPHYTIGRVDDSPATLHRSIGDQHLINRVAAENPG